MASKLPVSRRQRQGQQAKSHQAGADELLGLASVATHGSMVALDTRAPSPISGAVRLSTSITAGKHRVPLYHPAVASDAAELDAGAYDAQTGSLQHSSSFHTHKPKKSRVRSHGLPSSAISAETTRTSMASGSSNHTISPASQTTPSQGGSRQRRKHAQKAASTNLPDQRMRAALAQRQPSGAEIPAAAATTPTTQSLPGRGMAENPAAASEAAWQKAFATCVPTLKSSLLPVAASMEAFPSFKRRRPSGLAWGSAGAAAGTSSAPGGGVPNSARADAWLKGALAQSDADLLKDPAMLAGMVKVMATTLAKYQAAFQELPAILMSAGISAEDVIISAGNAAKAITAAGARNGDSARGSASVQAFSVDAASHQVVQITMDKKRRNTAAIGDRSRSGSVAAAKKKIKFYDSSSSQAKFGFSKSSSALTAAGNAAGRSDQGELDATDSDVSTDIVQFRHFSLSSGVPGSSPSAAGPQHPVFVLHESQPVDGAAADSPEARSADKSRRVAHLYGMGTGLKDKDLGSNGHISALFSQDADAGDRWAVDTAAKPDVGVALLSALVSRRPVYVDDMALDPRLHRRSLHVAPDQGSSPLLGDSGSKSSLASPSGGGGQHACSMLTVPVAPLGPTGMGAVLALTAPTSGAFSAPDLSVLGALAPVLSSVLQLAAGGSEGQKALQQAELLTSMVQSVYKGQGYQDIITSIIDVAYKLLEADRVSVFVVEGDSLVLTVSEDAAGVRIPLGAGIAGTVATTNAVVNIQDAYQDDRFNSSMDKKTGYRTRSLLCMPVADETGTVVAVIQAINKLARSGDTIAVGGTLAFDDRDVELMRHVTDTAGVVLAKATLLARAEAARAQTLAFTRVVKLVTARISAKSFWQVLDALLCQVYTMVPAAQVTFYVVDDINQTLRGRKFIASEHALETAHSRAPTVSEEHGGLPSPVPEGRAADEAAAAVAGNAGNTAASPPHSRSRSFTGAGVSAVMRDAKGVPGEFTDADIPVNTGVSGSLASGTIVGTQMAADAWKHASFDKHSDVAAQFRTRTLLAVPVVRHGRGSIVGSGGSVDASSGSKGADKKPPLVVTTQKGPTRKPVAVLQLVNKLGGRQFTVEDAALLEALSAEVYDLVSQHGLAALYERTIAQNTGGDSAKVKSLLGMYSEVAAGYTSTTRPRARDDMETSSHRGPKARAAKGAGRARGSFTLGQTAVGRGLLHPGPGSGRNLDTLRETSSRADIDAAFARLRNTVEGDGSPTGGSSSGMQYNTTARGSFQMAGPGTSIGASSAAVPHSPPAGAQAAPEASNTSDSLMGSSKRKSMPARVGIATPPPGEPPKRRGSGRNMVGLTPLSPGKGPRRHSATSSNGRQDGAISVLGAAAPGSPTRRGGLLPEIGGGGSVTSGRRGSRALDVAAGDKRESVVRQDTHELEALIRGGSGARLEDFDFADAVYAHVALPPAVLQAAMAKDPKLSPQLMLQTETVEQMKEWTWDAFDYDKPALQQCAVDMVLYGGLADEFDIPMEKLATFISTLSHLYRDNPYHNWHHAVSVMQNSFLACETYAVCRAVLQPVDKLATLLGALCHDVDHPGLNNTFWIASEAPLALRYNDKSVLENHHAAVMFQLLNREPATAILENVEGDVSRVFRSRAVKAILNTDMTHHMTMVNFIKQMPDDATAFWTEEESAKKAEFFASDVIVHCADINNPVLPKFQAVRKWALAISQEFTNQVQAEKEAGLPFAPFMDNLTNPLVFAKSQVGFSNFVIKPLYAAAASVFHELEPLVLQLNDNVEQWKALVTAQEAAEAATQRSQLAKAATASGVVATEATASRRGSEMGAAASGSASPEGSRTSSPGRRRHTIAISNKKEADAVQADA